MRKLFISALSMLAVAMGFTACSSDDDFESTSDQSGRIRAYATTEQASATRTTLNGNDTNGYQVFWSADDEITIGGKVFELIKGDGTSTGGFELKYGEADPEAGTYTAFYPKDYDGTNWPTTQTYVANNIPQGVPMKATGISVYYGEGPMVSPISFKNEGGILRLNLKGTAKVTSITISATNLDNPITLNSGSTGVELNTTTATPFHIAVQGTDEGTAYSGLKIEITDDAGAVCTKTLKSDKTITVKRSKITDITLTAGSFVVPTTGTAKRTGDIDVNWVQLWENGPKFAEYNVGVTDGKAESFGGYYCWGKTADKDASGAHKEGVSALTGTDDTATNLWGGNWRMPTKEEFDNLLTKCDVKWIDGSTKKYNNTTVTGLLCTGKGAYSSNSVFLPAAGYFRDGGVKCQGYDGVYWSSTPQGSDRAYDLYFNSDEKCEGNYYRYDGFSVRAVFKEAPATTGTAEVNESAGITGNKVNWVQLWENGPKFAEYNIGATSATDYGGYYTWGGTYKNGNGIAWSDDHNTGSVALFGTDDTATKLWGENWRMPTKEEFDNLLTKCDVKWIDGSTEKYNNTTVTGLLCTGKDAYSSNSVFLPAAGYNFDGVVSGQGDCGVYWSSTPKDSDIAYDLYFNSDTKCEGNYYHKSGYSVRAVLAE